MKKALLAILVIVGMIGSFGLGNKIGKDNAYSLWSGKVVEAHQLLKEGTYHMAWTNVRACVLAVDSTVMRFLSSPDPEHFKAIGDRYKACEQHWELLSKYSPEDPEEYRRIDEARFTFDNWANQIAYMINLQVRIITAMNEDREDQAQEMYKSLMEERDESRKFRDHIESELFKAW